MEEKLKIKIILPFTLAPSIGNLMSISNLPVPSTPPLDENGPTPEPNKPSKLKRSMRPKDTDHLPELDLYDNYMLMALPDPITGECNVCHTLFKFKAWAAQYVFLSDEEGRIDRVRPDGVRCIHRSCPGYHAFKYDEDE